MSRIGVAKTNVAYPVREFSLASPYTVVSTDFKLTIKATAGSSTLTLCATTEAHVPGVFSLKFQNTSGGTRTISASGGETIIDLSGTEAATQTVPSTETVLLECFRNSGKWRMTRDVEPVGSPVGSPVGE